MDVKRNVMPEVGIHTGITYDEYSTWNAFNSHMVTPCLRSLKHLEHYIKKENKPSCESDEKEKKCYILGRMVECLVFEPDTFEKSFAVLPDFYTGAKGESKAWIMSAKECQRIYSEIVNSGATPIKSKWKTLAQSMAESLKTHETASAMIGVAKRGIALVWKDETFNILCKAFLDALTVDRLDTSRECIGDLKTTANASKNAFTRQIGNFGYHIQGAFYVDGYRILTKKEAHFDLLVVEYEEPFCSAVYRLDAEAIQTGQGAYTRALKRYVGYLEGERSGYSDFVEEVQLFGYVVAEEITEEAKDDSINGI